MFVMSLLPSGNREKAVIRLMASWLDSRLSCSTGSLGKVVQPCSPELSGTPQGLTAVPAAEYEGAQGAQVQPEGCVVPCLGGQQAQRGVKVERSKRSMKAQIQMRRCRFGGHTRFGNPGTRNSSDDPKIAKVS
eukprot:CAMPEP_0202906658 /NCGR_PEP_ID=MMETSP1392-20130828/39911_1 /ASSEMBLY_ACC=CAM_ASM_000868 /TAXON_ID=225041 /ORGANISM="Chlamydomonas chlamydogama, Strain SAG 11-48b" /LENGTH=132 /DNA_ID=CAMNT_0049595285 /DNA_START=572 /DNA_END=971 /DNA_ORIENTATION=-